MRARLTTSHLLSSASIVIACSACIASATPPVTTLLVAPAKGQTNNYSAYPAITPDGRFVAFLSAATNLVTGDTNNWEDVFVLDRQTGIIERVGVSTNGTQANDDCYSPSISHDGRYVGFESWASNLVPGDTNAWPDVFVHDRQSHVTTRISVNAAGVQGNGPSYGPSLSADGQFIAYNSRSTNLVPGGTDDRYHIYRRTMSTGEVLQVDVTFNGQPSNGNATFPSISADGRYIGFTSGAGNIVPGATSTAGNIYVRDMLLGVTEIASVTPTGDGSNGFAYYLSLSADGRRVAFQTWGWDFIEGDDNEAPDVYLRDLDADVTTLVSVNSQGVIGNGYSGRPVISPDGRYVVFESLANNLDPADQPVVGWGMGNDIFIRDLHAGVTRMVSVNQNGQMCNNQNAYAWVSEGGRSVVFASVADDLVPNDTNNAMDIFLREYPEPTAGDTNGDGAVDVDDLVAVILGWGPCAPAEPCAADVNQSAAVDVDDLVIVILNWT